MPHYTCSACHARRTFFEDPPEPVGHLCPVCGALLDPVPERESALRPGLVRSAPALGARRGSHVQLARRVHGLLAGQALRESSPGHRAVLAARSAGGHSQANPAAAAWSRC